MLILLAIFVNQVLLEYRYAYYVPPMATFIYKGRVE